MKAIKIKLVCCVIVYLATVTLVFAKTTQVALVGSTPADAPIKSILGLALGKEVDFIKWDLKLLEVNSSTGKFSLAINYGLSQPNTLGFINGGERQSLSGNYSVINKPTGKIYRLSNGISFIQVNNNVFQLLATDGNLMKGGGGWSYTLNRKDFVPVTAEPKSLVASAFAPGDKSPQVIFEGRTPCLEIATGNQMQVKQDCFKLKWKFTLNRNPTTLEPTTFAMRQVDGTAKEIEGKWTIIKDKSAIMYKLEPSMGQPIYLLVGDYNVLYFADKNANLYQGNQDFSYTLNKRTK